MSPRRDDARVAEAVQGALDLISRHGLEAFELKHLSYRLSISEPDLLALIGDRHQLLDRCLEAAMAEIVVPEPDAETWLEQARSLSMDYWQALVDYPGMSQYIVTFQRLSPSMLHMVESGVGMLVLAGFDQEKATELFMAVAGTVLARAALDSHRHLEWGREVAGETTTRERFLGIESWRRMAEEVGVDDLPMVAGYLERADDWEWSRVVFATELDLMLRGIDATPR